jgi:hypothetical protein
MFGAVKSDSAYLILIFIYFHFMKIHRLLSSLQRQDIFRQDVGIDPYSFILGYSAFVLLLLLHCFIFILVLLLCCVSRSSLYCNIPSDLCPLFCLVIISTLFFLYLYCCYVVYTDHHFTVIYLQTKLSKLMICIHNMITVQA